MNTNNCDCPSKNSVSKALSQVLADTYVLYLKTQNFHWNVQGPLFVSLHAFFETEYKALAEAIDETAERIRSLGKRAPGSFSEFQALATLKESQELPNWKGMLSALHSDHKSLLSTLKNALTIAETAEDAATADFVTERIASHEKTCWMLASLLTEECC